MPFLPLVMTFLSSRVAQIGLALIVGFVWGWWKTDVSWREHDAKQNAAREAAYRVELAREAQNAAEIAKAATERAASDAAELSKLKQQVADFDKDETHAQNPCTMDDLFVDAARKLRQPARRNRPAKVTRPPK